MTSSTTPTTQRASWTEITDVETLTGLLGEPGQRAREKTRDALTELDVAWLRAAPFCVIATASAAGDADASPKGDPAGRLVHVIDERTIALAERPGNRRADGYRNILENPYVGLLFVIPGRGDTLRVNGRARLVSDAPFFVEIDELFHHCAKALLRSSLWQPETWDPEAVVPRRAVLAHELERPETPVAELDEYYGPAYADGLYREPGA
jgi:PPOX class probable FMN-dependent enzyme